jgi:hypothetical protein
MFQLAEKKAVPITAQLLDFPAFSRDEKPGRALRVSMFSYSSEILEKRGKIAAHEAKEIMPPVWPSETNQNTAANRTSRGASFEERLTVAGPGLHIKKVARVDDRLRAHGQTKRGQVLGHLHAQ